MPPEVLNVNDGDDLDAPIANATGDPIVVPGSAARANAPTYTSSGLDFTGQALLADGWVHVDFSGLAGNSIHPVQGVVGDTEMGGYADGEFGGGHWLLDQTATNLHLSVWHSGGSFGNEHGRIIFEGVGDVRGSTNWSDNSSHDMTYIPANSSATLTVQNVSWPDGTYVWRSENNRYEGNCGFCWSNRPGDLIFDGCYWHGFPNNCLYMTSLQGQLTVRNSYFKNIVAGTIRTGADGGTVVEDTTFSYGTIVAYAGFSGGSYGRAIGGQSEASGTYTIDLTNIDVVNPGTDFSGGTTEYWGYSNIGTFDITVTNCDTYDLSTVSNHANMNYTGSFGENPTDPGTASFTDPGDFEASGGGGTPSSNLIHAYDGTDQVAATPHYYTGSTFAQPATVRQWDGSQWRVLWPYTNNIVGQAVPATATPGQALLAGQNTLLGQNVLATASPQAGTIADASPPPAWTTTEDFESGTWPGAWTGNTADFALTDTNVIEGTWSLWCSTTGWPKVANTNLGMSRDGTEYAVRVRNDGANGEEIGLLAHAQDAQFPGGDTYSFFSDGTNISLISVVGGTPTTIASGSWTRSSGTPFDMAVTTTASDITARIYDTSGTQLASLGPVANTDHSGGSFGIYSGGSSNNVWDDIRWR